MPIFEYACDVCETKFEELVRGAGNAGGSRCPECGSAQAHRLLSVFGLGSSRFSTEGGGSSGRASCASCRARSCANCR